MPVTTQGVGVPVPYQNAAQETTDQILWQVYYRTFGVVGMHIGIAAAHDAAVWLAANGRGGQIKWVVPGRAFVWTGISTAPGLQGSQKMGALFAGSGLAQLNTAIARVDFWAPRLWARLLQVLPS